MYCENSYNDYDTDNLLAVSILAAEQIFKLIFQSLIQNSFSMFNMIIVALCIVLFQGNDC